MNKLACTLALSAALALPMAAHAADTIADNDAHFHTDETDYRTGFGKHADRLEFRLGAGSYDTGPLTRHEKGGVTVNGEAVMPSPAILSGIGSPRPYVGIDVAGVKHAQQFAYGGLTWDYHISPKVYLSGSFGGAMNNGRNLKDNPYGRSLGSNLGFHVGAAVGYDFTPDTTAQLYVNHFSNAYLASPNDGQESAGVRFGMRF